MSYPLPLGNGFIDLRIMRRKNFEFFRARPHLIGSIVLVQDYVVRTIGDTEIEIPALLCCYDGHNWCELSDDQFERIQPET
jgi:hypothetical protein